MFVTSTGSRFSQAGENLKRGEPTFYSAKMSKIYMNIKKVGLQKFKYLKVFNMDF